MLRPLLALTLAVLTLPAVAGEAISCPDLKQARVAGQCPSEDELLYTYNGFCSDNARIYKMDNDACLHYSLYREKKNIVLWESSDGRFLSYVSCDLPETKVRNSRPTRVHVDRAGTVSRVRCDYDNGLSFSYRSKETCSPRTAASCADDPAACAVVCE